MRRILFAVGLFALLAALILYAFAEQSSARIKGEPGWLLVAMTDAKIPPRAVNKARRLVAQQPLDQAMLNLIFAAETRGDMSEERRDRFARALGDLGWRDTPAQQNLIVEAARLRDPKAAVLRADALLRRGKLVDGILPIMVRLESFPEAAELLIERLALEPDWRQAYFRLGAVLSDPATLDARVQLFDRMLAKGMSLSHTELKPSLDALMRAGRRADAAHLALRANRDGAAAPLYDPEFAKMIALTARDRESPLPFEWETFSRPGISAQIVPRGDAGQLLIRWNGVGVPTFARTMVLISDIEAPRLVVMAGGRQDTAALAKLGFALVCPRKGGAIFAPEAIDQEDHIARFRLSAPVPCDFPDLVVAGRPQANDAAVDVAIDSIRLLPE